MSDIEVEALPEGDADIEASPESDAEEEALPEGGADVEARPAGDAEDEERTRPPPISRRLWRWGVMLPLRWIGAHPFHFLAIILVVFFILIVVGHVVYIEEISLARSTHSRHLFSGKPVAQFVVALDRLKYFILLGFAAAAGLIFFVRHGRNRE